MPEACASRSRSTQRQSLIIAIVQQPCDHSPLDGPRSGRSIGGEERASGLGERFWIRMTIQIPRAGISYQLMLQGSGTKRFRAATRSRRRGAGTTFRRRGLGPYSREGTIRPLGRDDAATERSPTRSCARSGTAAMAAFLPSIRVTGSRRTSSQRLDPPTRGHPALVAFRRSGRRQVSRSAATPRGPRRLSRPAPRRGVAMMGTGRRTPWLEAAEAVAAGSWSGPPRSTKGAPAHRAGIRAAPDRPRRDLRAALDFYRSAGRPLCAPGRGRTRSDRLVVQRRLQSAMPVHQAAETIEQPRSDRLADARLAVVRWRRLESRRNSARWRRATFAFRS